MSIEREIKTARVMVDMYCRALHGSQPQACEECARLLEYATARLTHCRWGDSKPACKDCSSHCYAPRMREQMQTVMRYSGPRMLLRHPWLAFCHLMKKWGK